ncbi:MAG: ATP-dependent Clp protease ATP-binding subunit [Clostridia bacterium]|nr:ATP-dependent Clp protease ATP-binding subunit [Clostridia bacterium]
MTSRFTPAAQNALKRAQTEASEMGHTYIGTEHLLLGLLREESSVGAEILRKHGLDYKKVRQAVIYLNGSGNKTLPPPSMTPRLRSVIEKAAKEMPGAFGRIGTEQLLSALLSEKESVAVRIIEKHRSGSDILPELYSVNAALPKGEERKKLPPTLSKYGKNLCECRLDPVIGRENELESLIEALCRRRKNNPCLVGEAGVGKTAVVEGLASKIRDGNVPSFLLGKAIVALDIASIISGAKYRGEFEERMKTVLLEASEDPDIILFIDELHTIVGTGASEGAIDAGSIMKPSLARGEIRLIGATTVSEYRRHIESDPALERRFLPITVEEPTVSEAVDILTGIKEKYEEHHGIKIDESAIRAAVELSVRYVPSKRLPDKAIDLIDEAASAKRIELERRSEDEKYIGGIIKGLSEADDELARDVENRIKPHFDRIARGEEQSILLPSDVEKVLKKRRGSVRLPSESDLLGLENGLNGAVFGQKSAIKTVA